VAMIVSYSRDGQFRDKPLRWNRFVDSRFADSAARDNYLQTILFITLTARIIILISNNIKIIE